MKWSTWVYLGMVFLVAGFLEASAQETKKAEMTADTTTAAVQSGDEDWLNMIWTQVDDVVKKEELKLQETVTVAGVRGAEAEDNLLDKLYYKGGKRYPSQDKLKKAIETLKESIAGDPKGSDAPKMKFFVAQCYEKLGKKAEARDYYSQVSKDHASSKYAPMAKEAVAALDAK